MIEAAAARLLMVASAPSMIRTVQAAPLRSASAETPVRSPGEVS
jgi:hypothetical protein